MARASPVQLEDHLRRPGVGTAARRFEPIVGDRVRGLGAITVRVNGAGLPQRHRQSPRGAGALTIGLRRRALLRRQRRCAQTRSQKHWWWLPPANHISCSGQAEAALSVQPGGRLPGRHGDGQHVEAQTGTELSQRGLENEAPMPLGRFSSRVSIGNLLCFDLRSRGAQLCLPG